MVDKIRILEVSEATAGGTRRHLTDLVLNLDPARFDVSVACSTRRDPGFIHDIDRMRERGIPVHVVDMHREIRPIADARALLQLFRLMRKHRVDVVHTHSSKAGFLGRVAARFARVPFVVHTPHVFAFQMGVSRMRRWFYGELERLASMLSDRIVCVSRGEKEAALSLGLAPGDRFLVIPNGIESSEYTIDGSTVDRIRHELGFGAGEIVVGSVGRFVDQKGLDLFLQAGSMVAGSNPNVRLLLVGEGNREKDLRSLADRLGLDKRCLITAAHRGDKGIYSVCDVFVISSLWEGVPYALLEAMASARPIVATAVGGLAECLVSGRSGLLVPPGDVNALADGIDRIIRDPSVAVQLGAEAWRTVVSRYSLPGMIRSVEAIYESWLDQGRAKGDNLR